MYDVDILIPYFEDHSMNEKAAKGKAGSRAFTVKIVIGMFAGILLGAVLNKFPLPGDWNTWLIDDVLQTAGTLFINLIKMLVVPIVFVSLICGVSSLGNLKQLGRIGGKTMVLYLLTTALAIALALVVANVLQVGQHAHVERVNDFVQPNPPALKAVLLNIVPTNPFKAMQSGEMLQIILLALLIGIAMGQLGKKVDSVRVFFQAMDKILICIITWIMKLAPYGVFCLLATQFAKTGFDLILSLLMYFFAVLLVLFLQVSVVYALFLKIFARLNPMIFFRKIYSTLLFAFSISSSSASIPVTLDTVQNRLGVSRSVASFVIPMGATINMDGTAIMQGVATVFIAHVYKVAIGFTGYLTVILMATLASVGTAGVPSVGLITLAMVLEQVNLPVAGIALIIGVDRLLDMTRTAVNIAGDMMVSCVVAKSEKQLNEDVFQEKHSGS